MPSLSEDFAEASLLTNRLWRAMDVRDYDALLALFAADGRWFRDGAWQTGPEAIRASLERRPADLFVRHAITNLIVDQGADGVRCDYYLAAYGGRGPEPAGPRAPDSPSAMADMTTRLVREDGALRIAEIGMTVTFFRPHA